MSSVLNGMTITTADAAAADLQRILYPHCQRCMIAGSVRRRAQVVGDIEFVVIPKFEAPRDALPGTNAAPVDWLDEFLKIVDAGDHRDLKRPVKAKGAGRRPPWGPKYKKLLYQHVNRWISIDLWITSPERFGATLAIRTGDADFSRLLVTQRHEGGAMPLGLRQMEGGIRRFAGEPSQALRAWEMPDLWEPVDTPDEDAFFGLLGLPTLNPPLRTMANIRKLLSRSEAVV